MTARCANPKLVYTAFAVCAALLLVATASYSWADDAAGGRREGTLAARQETVIVSRRSDPYYDLAQGIAEAEELAIVEELTDALKHGPAFIILVASPQNLTKERLLDIGRVFRDSDHYPGFGIISGGTIEAAERLWRRAGSAQAGHNYVGGDTEPMQLVTAPTIYDVSDGAVESMALTKETLVETLSHADYLYWARHVAATNWFWNEGAEDWGEDDELFADEVPPMGPVVIYTPSCGSFRPWVPDNIALAFTDNGAAAYVGHTNSPNNSAFLRRSLTVPGISSWEGFPLGLVAQIDSRTATRRTFRLPQFFMLGDPRLHLSKERPYCILSDTIDPRGRRVIEGESTFDGVLAVAVDGGAAYEWVAIRGVTAASDRDLTFNSKLKMMNLGTDKYLLIEHHGGPFRIELAPRVPPLWMASDAALDLLDYSWVAMWLNVQVTNNPTVYLISLPLFGVILGWVLIRRKGAIRDYRSVFLVAALYALLRLAYFLARRDAYTVSADYLECTGRDIALGVVGILTNVAGGLMLLRGAKRLVGKLFGLAFAMLPQLVLTVFYLLFITLFNVATDITGMTASWLWNYHALFLVTVVLGFELTIVLGLRRLTVGAELARRALPSRLQERAPSRRLAFDDKEKPLPHRKGPGGDIW